MPKRILSESALGAPPIAPPARPEFRAELRDLFLEGRFLEGAGSGRDAGPPEPPSEAAGGLAGRRSALRIVVPLVAAAAAVLLVLLFDGGGSAWSLSLPAEAAAFRLDGEPVGAEGLAAAAQRLAGGGEIETGDGALRLDCDDRLRLQVGPESRLRIEPLAAARRPVELRLTAGRLLGTTGPSYAPGELKVHTPHGVATVVGTSFIIDAEPVGSCVCVASGGIRLWEPAAERTHAVGDSTSTFLYADGRPATTVSLTEGGAHLGSLEHVAEHGAGLGVFLERHGF